MENVSQFDLNTALRQWLEQLGQSPQIKAENLKELESHIRDSVVRLQSKGLSSEESFLIAIRTVGSVGKLEPEFAKVNRSPWNMIIHGVILAFFSAACWILWALLLVPRMFERMLSDPPPVPAFTRLLIGCSPFLAVPPLLALVYCLYALSKKSDVRPSWMRFLAATVGAILLLAFPIIVAVLLHFVEWIYPDPFAGN